jgi:hypothetical protein
LKKQSKQRCDFRAQNLGSFAWSVAELLSGDFQQSEFDKDALPFVVPLRLDCTLADKRAKVLAKAANLPESGHEKALPEIRWYDSCLLLYWRHS